MAVLRIAVPNKGELAEPASQLLQDAGYRQRRDLRELALADPRNEVEFFYLRPRDIAVYVGAGTVDVGITGRDLLLDSGADAIEHLELGFGVSTFQYAAPPRKISSIEEIDGKRIATSYSHLVTNHLRSYGVDAQVVRLDGAVETAVRLGVADAVADVVETGATLRAAGLEVFGDPILVSEAVLVRRPDTPEEAISTLTGRIRSVLIARQYILLDYDIPESALAEAAVITPGYEAPTVTPLHGSPEWRAVRVLVPRSEMNHIMDKLYAVGARAIIATELLASRV